MGGQGGGPAGARSGGGAASGRRERRGGGAAGVQRAAGGTRGPAAGGEEGVRRGPGPGGAPRPNEARRTRGAGTPRGSSATDPCASRWRWRVWRSADRRGRGRRAETPPRTAAETDDEKAAETIVRGVGTRVRPGLVLPRGVPRPPRVCRRLDPPTQTPTTRGGGLSLAASRRSRTDSSRASPPRRILPPREQTPACYSPGGVTDTGYSASETTSIATNPRASRCDWRLGDGDGDGDGSPRPRGGGSRAP